MLLRVSQVLLIASVCLLGYSLPLMPQSQAQFTGTCAGTLQCSSLGTVGFCNLNASINVAPQCSGVIGSCQNSKRYVYTGSTNFGVTCNVLVTGC